jgi:glyoxylase-like metal-dependent hydrolase (beta-lactamase superfamily II)
MRVDTPRSRRTFLTQLGRGGIGLALAGVAACGPSAVTTTRSPVLLTLPPSSAPPDPSGVESLEPDETDDGAATPSETDGSTTPPAGAVAWQRVALGFVSAYVLVRDGEVAVVDTGVTGSEDDIESALTAVGLEWDVVRHVILTHKHPDHIGSIGAVLERARTAVGYAGAEDLPSILAPRELRVAADGDEIFGVRVVATPGHTKGSISVFDPIGRLFIAGDALNTSNGKVTGPNPDFTEDMRTASASVAKIAALDFDTLLVGHGDPVDGGAAAQVAKLVGG